MRHARYSLLRSRFVTIALVAVFGSSMFAAAQNFTVIHAFAGPDGTFPQGALAMDGAGNIYGTTRGGGSGHGNVYKLSYRNSWVLNLLYNFQSGGADGVDPRGGIAFGPNGTLYGTTWNGDGNGCTAGCGSIFNLRPPRTRPVSLLTPWNETQLHKFLGTPDGQNPSSTLAFDQSGAAYGTTPFGGNQSGCLRSSCGTVYQLTGSGDQWTERIIYAFTGDPDGAQPFGGVVLDNDGNLFGTTYQGGQNGFGTVYELMPSGGGWSKTFLHQFTGGQDGANPETALLRDDAGNFFGSTYAGGQHGGGVVFELSPSGNGWNFSVLHSFEGGGGPLAPLTIDSAGNLYGTTYQGGTHGFGVAFELSRSDGGWTYNVLHNFSGLNDGGLPISPVLVGPNGALFGTAYTGGDLTVCGNSGCGVIWQIIP